MTCQDNVGILDQNGKLTVQAKNSFISLVLLILEYGTENIPADKKPKVPFPEKLEPSPAFKLIKDPEYLKDEKKYSGFHRTWLARYEKLANDLNLKPNYSFLPAFADPISLAKDAFNADIPPINFPGGFVPYFSGLLPVKLIGDLIDAGDTGFLSPTGPAKLIKTMMEKKAPPPPVIPSPPVILPPPLPPGFSLPKPEININVDLSPEQILANAPKPPEAVFSSLSKKEFAAVQNVPKIVTEIVGKIPSLITKLNDPGKVVGEIATIVKKSGAMGPPAKESAYLEKAAEAVLIVKLAELLIVATLAITIGSSPGSATTAITQETSSREPENKYIPIGREKKETKKTKLTPAEKAARYAEGLRQSYYGNKERGESSERERYLEGLFYAENYFRGFPKDSLNVYGEFPTDDPENVVNVNQLKSSAFYSEQTSEAQREATPVMKNDGFFKQAERAAGQLSSCGMFVRGCLQAAGASNRFFVSMYTAGTAIKILVNIGVMRNYRWVSENCVAPNYEYNFQNPEGGRAIINDLYEVKIDENKQIQIIERDPSIPIPNVKKDKKSNNVMTVGDLQKLLKTHAGSECKYNGGAKNEISKKQDEFRSDWSLNKDLQPNLYWLTHYLKPRDKRSILWGFDIGSMLRDPESETSGFPSLVKGDAILINKLGPGEKYPNSHWIANGEHVLLITNDRNPGYSFNYPETGSKKRAKFPILRNVFYGIEGGALDDYNTKEVPKGKTFKKPAAADAFKALVKNAIGSPNPSDSKLWHYVELYDGISSEKAEEMIKEFEDEGQYTLHMTVEVPKPSAILECTYDRGEYAPTQPPQNIPDNYSGAIATTGFFIGTTNMARSNPNLNKINSKNLEPIGVSHKERKIIAIFKTDNYCNEAENIGPLASIAVEYMDGIDHNNSRKYFRNEKVFNVYAFDTFPGKVKSY